MTSRVTPVRGMVEELMRLVGDCAFAEIAYQRGNRDFDFVSDKVAALRTALTALVEERDGAVAALKTQRDEIAKLENDFDSLRAVNDGLELDRDHWKQRADDLEAQCHSQREVEEELHGENEGLREAVCNSVVVIGVFSDKEQWCIQCHRRFPLHVKFEHAPDCIALTLPSRGEDSK